ncbi:MAG: hypothetical protein IT425_07055 [Pirellulales bacterium]|nr:hypothetical protein [Pirellulales bacterium]
MAADRIPTLDPVFHDDATEAVPYRSLSASAVVGLALGLLSPLSFGGVLLYVVPVAGAAVSLFAFRQIAKSEGSLAGRGAAAVGLFLAVAMLVAPVARAAVIRHDRTSQAQAFGERWLALVTSGDVMEAFRLSVDSTRSPSPLEPHESSTPQQSPLDKFTSMPLVKALVALGKDASIRLVATEGYDAQTFPKVFVRQHYELKAAGSQATTDTVNSERSKPIHVWLTLHRARQPNEERSRWLTWALDDGSKKPTDAP